MEFMHIPEGEMVRSASDLFAFDENDALNFRELYVKYKNKLPMLICIQGGNYGTTRYDCYDNFQVIRLHGISLQPRVAADDARRVTEYKDGILTIPENSLVRFQQVLGHDRYGERKKLCEILAGNDTFPINIAMASNPGHPIRVGTSRQVSQDFEHLLIKIRYKEPFFMMNCIDMTDLKMNPVHCMACLCEDLIASPITGFKYKSKISFDEYCNRLTHQAATSGEVYDTTDGNPDFCEYAYNDFMNLLDICEHKEGLIEREIEEEPELSEDDEYEEIPPLLPDRKPFKQEEKKIAKAATEQVKTVVKQTSKEDHLKPGHGPSKVKHEGLISKLIHHGHKTAKNTAVVGKTNEGTPKAYAGSKSKTSESDECKEKVPERPAKPALNKTVKPPPREKVTPQDRETNVQTNLKHREYQNTKVGRATVKPFQHVQANTEESVQKVKKEDVYEESGIYNETDETGDYEEPFEKSESDTTNQLQYKPSQYVTGKAIDEDVDDVYDALNECAIVEDNTDTTKADATEDITPDKMEQYSSEVHKLSIDNICESLKALRLDKYIPAFRENMIDGSVLCELSASDMVETLAMRKLEAIRLHAYAKTGRIPK